MEVDDILSNCSEFLSLQLHLCGLVNVGKS